MSCCQILCFRRSTVFHVETCWFTSLPFLIRNSWNKKKTSIAKYFRPKMWKVRLEFPINSWAAIKRGCKKLWNNFAQFNKAISYNKLVPYINCPYKYPRIVHGTAINSETVTYDAGDSSGCKFSGCKICQICSFLASLFWVCRKALSRSCSRSQNLGTCSASREGNRSSGEQMQNWRWTNCHSSIH